MSTFNPALTADQTKEITGGRRPLVPIEYDRALTALRACQKIDDAKYWADSSDALAAWAKIYHSDEAERQAKCLKLHAYQRMGVLAEELRPRKVGNAGRGGAAPGPVSLLMEGGLTRSKANSARQLAKIPPAEFDRLLQRPNPPSIHRAVRGAAGSSDAWKKIIESSQLMSARSFARKNPASELARKLNASEAAPARQLASELNQWLDEFERCIPKDDAS